jgi:signal transduction histidine kinase
MKSSQTTDQQADKSKGDGVAQAASAEINKASNIHAAGRVRSGFDLLTLVSEYRALRASVIRLWRESAPDSNSCDLEDLTRFNESIDQSLTAAIQSYTEHVDRSRQMFLAILGHDLRNPLNSIVMSAELLGIVPLDTNSRLAASQIKASALAMGEMIGDLLIFTGSGLGAAMPLAPASMDLKILCEEVINEITSACPTAVVSFQARGELTGFWDAARLRQLISNLLGNALQHGCGEVDISVSSEGTDAMLVVHNGGQPIPAEVLPTLFDPLVRGAASESPKARRPGSIGLGLYIAREVATAHGGTIDVKSTAETGTTFTVRLPRHRAND